MKKRKPAIPRGMQLMQEALKRLRKVKGNVVLLEPIALTPAQRRKFNEIVWGKKRKRKKI